jgi:hypothetical protein
MADFEVLRIMILCSNRIKRLNEERIAYWLERGAQPSDTVRSLLKQKGISYKRELVKKGLEAEKIVEEMRKWEVVQIEKGRRREAAKTRAKKTKAEKAESAEAKPDDSTGGCRCRCSYRRCCGCCRKTGAGG